MIEAVVHKKVVSELQNSEDCLTSTVWGLLKYRPMRTVLARFLGKARLYGNSEKCLRDKIRENRFEQDRFKVTFWKRVPEFGEPDILIECGDFILLVEDKLYAPLSGEDQLTKYGMLLKTQYSKYEKYVIYLTAHWDMPSGISTEGLDGMVYWLSWYELHTVVSELESELEVVAKEMASDLIRYLSCFGFYYFRGFSPVIVSCHEDQIFWNDAGIISKYELQRSPVKWFWQEEL